MLLILTQFASSNESQITFISNSLDSVTEAKLGGEYTVLFMCIRSVGSHQKATEPLVGLQVPIWLSVPFSFCSPSASAVLTATLYGNNMSHLLWHVTELMMSCQTGPGGGSMRWMSFTRPDFVSFRFHTLVFGLSYRVCGVDFISENVLISFFCHFSFFLLFFDHSH